MHRYIKSLMLLFLVLGFPVLGALEASPRIVSLAPHLTEIAVAAGVGSALVGVDRYSNFPASIAKIPKVGDAFSVDPELLLRLDVDYVLIWQQGHSQAFQQRLSALDLQVVPVLVEHLDDIGQAMIEIAALAGYPGRGQQAARRFRASLAELRRREKPASPIRTFIQISNEPVFTVGGDHFLTQAAAICGAVNIFSDLSLAAASVDLEAIASRAPDLIILSENEALFDHKGLLDKPYECRVDPDLIHRPGPRIIQGIEAICDCVARVSRSSR